LRYVSPSCERISGYRPDDFIQRPALLHDIVVDADKGLWDAHECGVGNQATGTESQFRIEKPDGEACWIEHVCQPVLDHQGDNLGVRASNRDVSRRETYRSETKQLQSALAHVDRVVTINALTTTLAHEINQPLAAIRSYAQAALRFMDRSRPDYENIHKALQGIVADNKRAADVINRIRSLVRKGKTHREKLNLNDLVKGVLVLIDSEIVQRGASISLELDPRESTVQGDSVQLQQVILNLLTNALDALEDQPQSARTITITIQLQEDSRIRLTIADSGEGIAPDRLKTVFLPFHTTKPKGMGLGLAICKNIIEAHDGEIQAGKQPPRGACFTITLPTE
jgi:PAS domain S-box-containing protein